MEEHSELWLLFKKIGKLQRIRYVVNFAVIVVLIFALICSLSFGLARRTNETSSIERNVITETEDSETPVRAVHFGGTKNAGKFIGADAERAGNNKNAGRIVKRRACCI